MIITIITCLNFYFTDSFQEVITCLNFYFTDSFQEVITCLNFYFTDSFQELRVFDLNPSASMEGRILSKRDNPKFSHNGYLYVFDKRSKKDTSIKTSMH